MCDHCGTRREDRWRTCGRSNEEIRLPRERCLTCETPVMSAVGHETDTTIIDYVAESSYRLPGSGTWQSVIIIRWNIGS